jgi:uncharacterized protein YdeI (BOF family)
MAFSSGLMLAQEQQPQQQDPAAQQQSQSDQQVTGKIVKSNDDGKYVLVDSSGTMYQLDDQNSAKKYEGKKVMVTGSLDSSSSTIHVTRIRPAK